MKVLLDTCVWGGVRAELESQGHDVVWTGDWAEDPGDEEILRHAYQDRRVLVTLDKDFGELAVLHRQPHFGILRLVGLSSGQQGRVCSKVLVLHGDDLQAGSIITAEPGRLRIRSAY